MYCVKCGVKLQGGVKACPLCGTTVYHPDIQEKVEPGPYPRYEAEQVSKGGVRFVVTALFLIPVLVVLLIDLKENQAITWGAYVIGGLGVVYLALLPNLWFDKPNPVIFFPIWMAGALAYTLWICAKTGGHWFLPFAFPVGGALLLWTEAMIVLLRYCVGRYPHRILFIAGGGMIVLGALCILVEFMLTVTFGFGMRWWSLYPLSVLALLGLAVIVVGAFRPLRESLKKKLFI